MRRVKESALRLLLCLSLVAALVLADTQLDDDTFTRTDASTLGSEWTRVTGECGGSFDLGIFSNTVDIGPNVGSSRCAERFNATTPASADYYAEVKLLAVAGGGINGVMGVGVRVSSSADTGYWCGFHQQAEGNIQRRIWRTVAAAYTSMATEAVNIAVNDVIQCRANGTTISMWVNGVEELSTTDSNITATGSAGIVLRHNAQDASLMDDFKLFDFTGAVAPPPRREPIKTR